MKQPHNILKYNIYDVLYNKTEKYYVLIASQNIKNIFDDIFLIIDNIKYKFYVKICNHGHTLIYICNNNLFQDCITLHINDDIILTKVNIYDEFPNEIIMSTLVLDENDYIIQWIKYNFYLGITKFIIYNNSHKDDIMNLLNEFIDNKEFPLSIILIKWEYEYNKNAQPTHQNHTLYAYKSSKYIGFFDIDEYINPQIKNINLYSLFESILLSNNLNYNNIGSIRILCKIFVNSNKQSEKNYDFLKIYNCHNICYNCREKNFIIPKNVEIFCIHVIVEGKQMINISENLIFFNHYMFLNKTDRYRDYIPELYDDSIKTIVNKYISSI